MKAVKLTKRVIDEFGYEGDGKSRDVRWDSTLTGFGVRIYPSGKKAFVLSYRAAGRKHLLTLGAYGPLTPDNARDQATRRLAEIIDGGNPVTERREGNRAKTVGDLCEHYITRYAPQKKTGDRDAMYLRRDVIPRWGAHRVAELKRSQVADLHHAIGTENPYAANRLLALVRRVLNLAIQWGFVEEGFVNPATKIQLYPEKPRDRWLTEAELFRVAAAIEEESNPYARAALWLYLLTGMRKSELLTARWADVDYDRRVLRLGETKSGRPHTVALNGAAMRILDALPREEGNPFIIAGKIAGSHLINVTKPWDRVRIAAKVQDVRLHDLRRTVGSWLAQNGTDIHLIGKVLNHTSVSTTAVYARHNQDVVHVAMEAHGNRIVAAARIKK